MVSYSGKEGGKVRSSSLKTTIHFEGNALARLAKLEYKKVFIIADPFIVSSGLINAVTKHLRTANIEFKVYSAFATCEINKC